MSNHLRQRQRALARSRSNNRLSRKLASVEQSEHEREFDRLMSAARVDRAEAVKSANEKYADALKTAENARKDALRKVDAAYLKARDSIVKRLASEGQQAA